MHLTVVVYSGFPEDGFELVPVLLGVQEISLHHLMNSVTLLDLEMVTGILHFCRQMAWSFKSQLGQRACTDMNCYAIPCRWIMTPESL